MNTKRKNMTRLMAVAAVTAALFSSAAVWAAAPGAPADAGQEWARHRQEMIKHHLDRMADRLEIKASQQGAWQAYVKTVDSIAEQPFKKPEGKSMEAKLDAAAITRMRADMVAARAQKLAQLADATAKLQEILTPEQRTTLTQMVAHAGHGRFHGHFSHGEEHGEHGKFGGPDEQGRGFGGNHDHG